MKKFKEYKNKVKQTIKEFPHWRKGQAHFNILCEFDLKLANSIRGTELDCFHRDDNIKEFCEFVKKEWDKSDFSWNEAIQKLYQNEE